MRVELTVLIDVDACDPAEFDPDTIRRGDPLEDKVVLSVEEAVRNSLQRDYENGFTHDMAAQVALAVVSVEARLVRPRQGTLFEEGNDHTTERR
jgi:hypothetical protein